MRKLLCPIALLTLTAFSDAAGCGDKFLVTSRATRFRRAPMVRPPAAILVYANPQSALPKALTNVPIEATLRKAGYQPSSVSTREELEAALQTRSWDVVVADLGEAQGLQSRITSGGALLLPVAYHASATVVTQAKKQYLVLLTAPTRIEAFLETVDDAVALTQKLHAKAK